MSSPLRSRTALLVGALLLSACASGATPEDPFYRTGAAESRVRLTVDNQDFRDGVVYMYWNGVRDRLGLVVGKTKKTFEMDWRSEEVQLEVDFVGHGGFRSETVGVWAGDHLDWVIRPGR